MTTTALDILAAVAGAARPALPPGARLGTIPDDYDPGVGYPSDPTLPTVRFDGETSASSKKYPVLSGYLPQPGDRVLLAPAGRTYVILGPVTNTPPTLNAHTAVQSEPDGVHVRLDQPPGCKVYLTDTVGIPNNSVTAVSFDADAATNYEAGGQWHSHSTNPSRVTVPAGLDGLYLVSCSATFAANGTGVRIANLLHNGTTPINGPLYAPNAIFGHTVNVTAPVMLEAGDYIELSVFQNSGGSLNLTAGAGSTFLAVIRFGGPDS